VPAYRLSGVAEQQIREALAWSEDRFGEVARSRYAALLVTAMTDVAKDPDQPNVAKVRIGGRDLGLYHIARSRRHVANRRGASVSRVICSSSSLAPAASSTSWAWSTSACCAVERCAAFCAASSRADCTPRGCAGAAV
jgi:plasmid stabilization system protein ParE